MRKDVPGWEDLYEADSETGLIYSKRTGKPLYVALDKNGYLITQFCRDKKRHTVAVHRVIARTFLGEKPDKSLTVNHKDGNKQNNRPDNLEYMDRSQQMYHAYALGLKQPVFNSNQKLTPEQVREIRKRYKRGSKGSGSLVLSREFGISESALLNIVNGKTYSWVED